MKNALIFIALISIALSSFPRVVISPVVTIDTDYSVMFSAWDGSSWTTPTVIIEADARNSTGQLQQRKVCRTDEGTYFYFRTDETANRSRFYGSLDGITWVEDDASYNNGDNDGYYRSDWIYPSYFGSAEGAWFRGRGATHGVTTYTFTTSGTDITISTIGGMTFGANSIISGTTCFDGLHDWWLGHRNGTGTSNKITIARVGTQRDTDYTIDYYNGSSVSVQLLQYRTTEPYHLIALAKDDDGLLCWQLFNHTNQLFNAGDMHDNQIVQLQSGRDDWCASTEAREIGDDEKLHLVFRNTTSLYYMTFESETWSAVADLGVSGATYPTIAVDDSANIMVSYIRNDQVYYIFNDGSWGSETTIGTNYINAGYLSSNQNEQNGELLLVWTANEVTTVDGQLEGMLNSISAFLGFTGIVMGLAFLVAFFSLGTYFVGRYSMGSSEATDIIIKPVLAIVIVGIIILVIALLNAMTV